MVRGHAIPNRSGHEHHSPRYEADWAIVERGWHAHVLGEGRMFASARDAVRTLRSEDKDAGDQYLPPFVIGAFLSIDHGLPS